MNKNIINYMGNLGEITETNFESSFEEFITINQNAIKKYIFYLNDCQEHIAN